MKVTFTDFVNQYRIQRSCILLQQDKTVAETCFECGFNNVTYFNKVFKKMLSTTPSEYKKAKLVTEKLPYRLGVLPPSTGRLMPVI